jgi:predicted AlkP superfamily phosphohydrolase/phosphomutase
MAEGVWRDLDTPARYLHASSWPSIYTGANPGWHGVYSALHPAPGLQGCRRFHKGLYGLPTFWKTLGGAGKRCAVLDAAYTHPEEGFRGTQIFDWGTWARWWRPMSVPGSALGRLRDARGDYPLRLDARRAGLAALDAAEMEERLVRAAVAKTDAALWLLDRDSWDLFFVMFCETHPGAHSCWPSRRTDAPGPADEAAFAPIRHIYEEVDQGIGRILDRVGREVTVCVISGEGAGPNRAGWHLLPEVLRRFGFLAAPPQPEERPGGPPWREGIAGRASGLLRPEVRRAIVERFPRGFRDAVDRRFDSAGIDWSRTRAYCLPTDLEGYIRINVKGREPKGIVDAAEGYAAVREELAAALRTLENRATGRRAVREVVSTDEAFPGPRRDRLPDLIVVWENEAEITDLHGPGIGTVRALSPDGRKGSHAPPGFALMRGPALPRGASFEGGSVLDLAPTLYERFGVPIPAGVEGRAWGEWRST